MSEAARSAPIATLKTRNARSDRSVRWSAALGHLLLVVPGGTVSENGRLRRRNEANEREANERADRRRTGARGGYALGVLGHAGSGI